LLFTRLACTVYGQGLVCNILCLRCVLPVLQLVDPSYCAADEQQLAVAQAEHGNSAEQFMAAVRNMMQMSSSLLADVPNKVEFCRQRIAQVRR
jgi:hypothetical protein